MLLFVFFDAISKIVASQNGGISTPGFVYFFDLFVAVVASGHLSLVYYRARPSIFVFGVCL